MEKQKATSRIPDLVIVYKGHGPYKRAGGTYDYAGVVEGEQLDLFLANGWYTTLPEAIDSVSAKSPKPIKENDDSPPTREELLQKASDLGLEFDKRIGNAKLQAMIEKALEGQGK